MTPEKQKSHPSKSPEKKKPPETKAHIEKKKELLKGQKEVKQVARKELTKEHLDSMKEQTGHTVAAGENIWRLIYNHAKQTGKNPIPPNKLEGINITVGDKIFFAKNEVIIKYLKGGTKKIAFEGANTKKEEKKVEEKPKIVKSEKTQVSEKKPEVEKQVQKDLKTDKKPYQPSIDTLDIALGTMNERHIEELTKKEAQAKIKKPSEESQDKTNVATIFDKESPLKGDQIAYKHEVEIKTSYGKKVKELIATHCKGSLIDEDFLYGVIARESRFDKNAKSYTGVKGLGQLTKDTVLTIANINEAKGRKYPEHSDFYVSDELRHFVPGKKKGEKGHYEIVESKALQPLNQIKLTISYLLYLEDMFSDVSDKKFKTELIITAYNLGPGKTKEIFDTYRGVKNWDGLKSALARATTRGDVSKTKAKETTQYVEVVKENIKKSKDIKLASL